MVVGLWHKSIRKLKRLCGNSTTSPKVSTTTWNRTEETTKSEPPTKVSTHPPSTAEVGYTIGINSTGPLIKLRPHQQAALDKIQSASKGTILVPTGGGKTLIAIMDACKRLESASVPTALVVVAPRILLASQLCEEFMEVVKENVTRQVIPAHIHSGDTSHFSTTKVQEIKCFEGMMETAQLHRIFFTTYHSLPRLAEAGISVDTIYFDEAHNSVQKSFYPATKYFSETAQRCYFFTATPKHSYVPSKPGMNNVSVYGNVIVNVAAPKLVEGGFIVPPQIVARELPLIAKGDQTADRDAEYLIQSIDENDARKVLVCAKAVKQITRMIAESDFVEQLQARGYSYMYIAASTGAVIDGIKVTREHFFKTLNAWGADNSKKFVVLHHSILSEGINVSGLEAVIFMRSMDAIGISQTIGRVIRLHKDDAAGLRAGTITPGALNSYTKSFGLVIVPMFTKGLQGAARAIENVVETVFVDGEAACSAIRR